MKHKLSSSDFRNKESRRCVKCSKTAMKRHKMCSDCDAEFNCPDCTHLKSEHEKENLVAIETLPPPSFHPQCLNCKICCKNKI